MLSCAEEKKKAKQSYQEALQNVSTVRQQAAVSHVISFALGGDVGVRGPGGGALNSVSISLDASVGK